MKTKKTEIEKTNDKLVKKAWRDNMRKLYPNFTKRAWARDSFRIKHPQSLIINS